MRRPGYAGRYVVKRRSDPKIGPHVETAAWVKAIIEHFHDTQETFAERLQMSRGGVAKWFYGKQEPSLRSFQKLKSVAPEHLKDFDSFRSMYRLGTAPAPAGDRPHIVREQAAGYVARSEEAAYIARRIDALEDGALREKAMEECSAKIRELLHPSRK